MCDTRTIEIDNGASITHAAGVDAGYYLSYGGGGAWHLEWTCDTKLSALGCDFSGSVTAPSLANAAPFKLEPDDLFTIGDGAAQWDTDTSTGIDGVDFTTNPGDAVHFDLSIDGTYYPDLVFVPSGGHTSTPDCLPIDVAPDSP